MKNKVVWTKSAQFDLEEIIYFIAGESPNAALGVYQKIKDRCVKLENYSRIGRSIPELKLQNIDVYREIVVDHWRVMFKVIEKTVYVLAVIDSRRNIDDALIFRALKM